MSLFVSTQKLWLPDFFFLTVKYGFIFIHGVVFRNMFRLCLWQTFVQVKREGCFGEGDLFISSLSVLSFFPLSMYVSYTLVHHFLRLLLLLCSSSCTPLQPTRLPSKRRRELASVWSAQGDSVCTQCLPSWANSSAAAVWAKPGALVVTNVPLQEQVRPPSHIRLLSFLRANQRANYFRENTILNTSQQYLTLIWPHKSAYLIASQRHWVVKDFVNKAQV